MAKKTMTWTINGNILTVKHLDDNDRLDTFDMVELFDNFNKLEEVQQLTIVNGVKQKLADSCARSKDEKLTPAERTEQMAKIWKRMVVDRKWTTKREVTQKIATNKVIVEGLKAKIGLAIL